MRKVERMRQFAPKARRAELALKVAREEVVLNQIRSAPYALVPNSICAECGGDRISMCQCLLAESECANGHHWYWCAEHRLRVNRARKGPCPHP